MQSTTQPPASCPVCGALATGSLGDWAIFNRHVNACIDRSDRTAAATSSCGVAVCAKDEFDNEGITRWLGEMGLGMYSQGFVDQEIDIAALPFVHDGDLKDSVGIQDADHREKILSRALMMSLFSGGRGHDGDGEDENKENEEVAGCVKDEPRKLRPTEQLRPWESMPLGLVVDCFTKTARAAGSAFVLTRFDTEKCKGLSKTFRGTLYCSTITRELCLKCMGMPPSGVRALPLGETFSVPECSNLRITFVDTNQMGAVMVVIEPPAEVPMSFAPILHTGDFCFSPSMKDDRNIKRLRDANCLLVLDTTFRSPEFVLPDREALVEFITSAIQAESFNPKTLFLIGADGIGMEPIYIAVARRLEKMVYCGKAKREVLSCLPLSAEDAARITPLDTITNLHVVSTHQLGWKRMKSILAHYKGKYTTVVGFKPSVCLAKRNRGRICRGKKTLVIYEVPYSVHSSFDGIREMVSFLQPSKIMPTDDVDRARETVARLVDCKTL